MQAMPSPMYEPVYTPAALQGEPPAWAHPTPSPSPLIRCPQEPPYMEAGGSSGSAGASVSPLVTQELLWEVMAPFVGQMVEALQNSVEKAYAKQRETSERARTSPSMGLKAPAADADAFRSLFGPSSAATTRGATQTLRRLPEEDEDEQQEARAFAAVSSSCPLPTREITQPWHNEKTQPHKVKFSPTMEERSNPSRTSSKASSPAIPGQEPSWQALLGAGGSAAASASFPGDQADAAASLPQKVYSPNMPEISDESWGKNNTTPVYVAWNQQGAGVQRWADQRMSPVEHTVCPKASPKDNQQPHQQPMPHGEGSNAAPQLVLATAVEDTSSPDAANSEKSVMVCRHWKSKGFCRLEATCKFLHPEHKRGTMPAAPAAKAAPSGATGNAGGPAASTDGAAPKSSTRSSRRAGRNRAAAGGAPGTMSSSNQVVAVGPLPQSMPAGLS